ncbi:hypothetical protein VU00_12303 [Candidatus Electrothrix marina]|uniref:Uncharacterized protein n=1 Tax=Candidatus Electrothrix marina TaxID=1859130 RepID=A0A444J955_9BACT|nr:hypothetical protein VU00_12303 [Candidatus Electrothrix marina]
MAEHKLPKLGVTGSNPVTRSISYREQVSAVDVGTAFNSYRDVVKVGFARFFLLFLQERCPALVISSIL